MKRALLLGIVLALGLPGLARAMPNTMAFTARITRSNVPVNGAVSIRFTLYDAETDGDVLWDETYDGVAVEDGLFFAALGSKVPFTDDVFAPAAIFLQIDVDGVPQLPRVGVHSVPYAAHAAVADKLGSLTEADVMALGGGAPDQHQHSAADITSGVLSPDRFTCYADLAAEGYLDLAEDTDLVTRVQGDARYAASGHGHDASAITAGTLSNARFSAYDNLSADARFDGREGTDLLIRTVADLRYLLVGGAYADLSNAGAINGPEGTDLLTRTQLNADFVNTGDAYADLGASGRLNNDNADDLVTQSQADGRYLNNGDELSGTNYGGCGGYSLLDCAPFQLTGGSGPACDQVPVGGICRAVSGGNPCSLGTAPACGDGGKWYLKVTP